MGEAEKKRGEEEEEETRKESKTGEGSADG